MMNSRFSRSFPCLIAVIAAALLAGCGDDSSNPSGTPEAPTYQQAFSGPFLGSSESGVLDLTLATTQPWTTPRRPSRLLGPSTSGSVSHGTVSGMATFEGTGSFPVSGTYDADADTFYFTTNGYAFSGRYYPSTVPPRLSGHIEGPHEGMFHCVVGQDTAVAVYTGHWGVYGTAYEARMGFATRGNHLVGAMLYQNPQWPILGYLFTGTIADGTPLRAIRANGRGLLDSLVLDGYADTSADTAGGSWTSIPLIDTIGSGWWHAARWQLAIPAARSRPAGNPR